MALIGAHMSISGGLDKALFRGQRAGCDVIQIFSHNNNQWESRPLREESLIAFKQALKTTCVRALAVHGSYLINPASSSAEIRRKSFKSLLEEVRRAALLGIPYVVIHPGAHLGEGESRGLNLIADTLVRLHDRVGDLPVNILLETTAGQGTNLGYRFEHIAEMISIDSRDGWLGVCLDTCHVFAAGYDFRSGDAYNEMIKEFDEKIGLERLKLFHINDSKKDLGSRVDRHEHLGLGFIGSEAFSLFLNDKRFKMHPFIIETPKGKDDLGMDWDLRNLNLIRKLMESKKKDDCH
jgi:deoxyribonuclease-4